MFDDLEKDALTELVNVAVSGAAVRLAGMVGKHVELSVPAISVTRSAEANEAFAQLGLQQLVAVRQTFEGAVSGETLLVFPEASVGGLLEAVIGEDVSSEEQSALAGDALAEVGNVVLLGFLGAIGKTLRKNFEVGLPQIVEGGPDDLMAATGNDAVLLVYMNFGIENRKVRGYFALVLGLSDLTALRQVLREYMVQVGVFEG
jgi:chemotaxis protein CheC